MLELIGTAMGKPTQNGRDTFVNALRSAGIGQAVDQFEDTEEEHDTVGGWLYQEEALATT